MAQNTGGQDWSKALVKRAGQAVKVARRGKSAAWLSDRTAELGYRISPTVIAKLDSGHRGEVLSVPELFVLAAALEIPPMLLLFPTYPDEEANIELLPGYVASVRPSADWLSGYAPLPVQIHSDGTLGPIKPPNDGTQLVGATGRRDAIERELFELQIFEQSRGRPPQDMPRIRDRIRDLQTQLAAVTREIGQAKAGLWGSAEGASDG